jgi:hypothetical protein
MIFNSYKIFNETSKDNLSHQILKQFLSLMDLTVSFHIKVISTFIKHAMSVVSLINKKNVLS